MTMPNHPPFSGWVFSEDALSPEEERALSEHLRACEACRRQQEAWSQVQRAMQTSFLIAPPPGFVNRWQARLDAQRLQRHRYHSWIAFLILGSLAVIFLGLLAWQFVQTVQSPYELVTLMIYRLSVLVSFLSVVGKFLPVIVPLLHRFSFLGVIFLTGFISLISVLWLTAFQKLSTRRIPA